MKRADLSLTCNNFYLNSPTLSLLAGLYRQDGKRSQQKPNTTAGANHELPDRKIRPANTSQFTDVLVALAGALPAFESQPQPEFRFLSPNPGSPACSVQTGSRMKVPFTSSHTQV